MIEVKNFINSIIAIHKTGIATEHSYRPALQDFLTTVSPEVTAINEPKKIACGAPDFIIQRKDVIVGHIEVKDTHVNIRTFKDGHNKKQYDRYLSALPNLIYTNCLDWDFYRDGILVASISIADLILGIQPKSENFQKLIDLLNNFLSQKPQKITNPESLAKIMAGKAQLIKDSLHNALLLDNENQTEISVQFDAFKEHLIHDINEEGFSDIYAETIAYGMFAARLHSQNCEIFTRQEALATLPKSNPFLRNLFTYIAGYNLDERISWIIDDLASVFQAVDINEIMKDFGAFTGQRDPFIHFYETFLKNYNPEKRKSCGVWYTPEAVVKFIVRAIDDVLQQEFKISDGLADTSKIIIDWDTGQKNKQGKKQIIKKEVHKVQVLDPATGTGTFLAEVIKQIAPKVKDVSSNMWSSYVETNLIPRLHGFEILMASYAMCHMKIDMILTELGYSPSGVSSPRLSVYLTNSLEEGEPANQTLPFAQWLSNEVRLANTVKCDMPIMCILGNPPYLGEGGKSEGWLGSLMDDYKKEPGGINKLNERTTKWLNDLYVKFIRTSSHLIEKNGEGVLGFITNHGYLDNPTFRGMRWHLLKTFSKIWILDLNGSAKTKKQIPVGKQDKNVFDIQQGVSIIIGIKKKQTSNELATVMHGDLWGTREEKYASLSSFRIHDDIFKPLECYGPFFFFTPKNLDSADEYNTYIPLDSLMPIHGNGIVTKRDALNIHRTRDGVTQVVQDFKNLSEQALRKKYSLPEDVRDWKYEWAKKDVETNSDPVPIQEINYRLFDKRYIFYSGQARGLVGWPVANIMYNYIRGENYGILTSKAHRDGTFAHAFVTNKPTEAIYFSATTGSNAVNFPLYIYKENSSLDGKPIINMDQILLNKFITAGSDTASGMIPNELDVFNYIYCVLHDPIYRDKYASLLKAGFPKIPLPHSSAHFWHMSKIGLKLRETHLMNPSFIGSTPYAFKSAGSDSASNTTIEKPFFNEGKIYINKDSYFDNVNESAWLFYLCTRQK